MSLAESPVHSSSSDDFAGLLERELESDSSVSSPGEEDEEDKEADDCGSDVESESRCGGFLSFMFCAVCFVLDALICVKL